jgi:hypothetical protein
VRGSIPIAAILVPAAFFLSVLSKTASELPLLRCGRFFEVKNRPRANPVRGAGGGDRDRGI